MDGNKSEQAVGDRGAVDLESDAGRRKFVTARRALIEDGLADARAGRVISFEAVSAWIDSWDTDHELPRPAPGQ